MILKRGTVREEGATHDRIEVDELAPYTFLLSNSPVSEGHEPEIFSNGNRGAWHCVRRGKVKRQRCQCRRGCQMMGA